MKGLDGWEEATMGKAEGWRGSHLHARSAVDCWSGRPLPSAFSSSGPQRSCLADQLCGAEQWPTGDPSSLLQGRADLPMVPKDLHTKDGWDNFHTMACSHYAPIAQCMQFTENLCQTIV